MANIVYPKYKEKLLDLTSTVDLINDTIKIVLLDSTYVYSDAHEFYSSMSSAVVGTAITLAGKSLTGTIFDADDVVFNAVSGNEVVSYGIIKDTGVEGTSPLLVHADTVSSGLPVTPNGGNISVTFSSATEKVFKL